MEKSIFPLGSSNFGYSAWIASLVVNNVLVLLYFLRSLLFAAVIFDEVFRGQASNPFLRSPIPIKSNLAIFAAS